MILRVINHKFHYECENICRVFFPNEKITVHRDFDEEDTKCVTTSLSEQNGKYEVKVTADIESQHSEQTRVLTEDEKEKIELVMARLIFFLLSSITSYTPPWGVLTGVRPSKLMVKLCSQIGEKAAVDYFVNDLLVTEERTNLTLTVAENEKRILSSSSFPDFSLYISIPFCPSRCSYCSFVSHSIGNSNAKKLLEPYVEKLCEEIALTAGIAAKLGLRLSSIYFGGGTPGVLNEKQFEKLFKAIDAGFSKKEIKEYNVEIGRPDTITGDKLKVLKEYGVDRISINPQTFNENTLKLIGRNHSISQIYDAFSLAQKTGFDCINTDLIAGLPGETLVDFVNSLDCAVNLAPESITVHSLALKRSSALNYNGAEVSHGMQAVKMLDYASEKLGLSGYIPYYMYRQSKCVGNLENVGWCKEGKEGFYNVIMIEENQTVLACGAGGVTKLGDVSSGYIERIFNYKYPYEYLSGFETLADRKKQITDFYEKI
ncbi:MAG: coproporphyrinogen dehydrogenase HemZ, partial [Clostridiales bacterium]|nr:coproporphyrinogen dehydrogenase HemZ [Clostridiales bacterium]